MPSRTGESQAASRHKRTYHRANIDWTEFDRLIQEEKLSVPAIAERWGMVFSTLYRAIKRRPPQQVTHVQVGAQPVQESASMHGEALNGADLHVNAPSGALMHAPVHHALAPVPPAIMTVIAERFGAMERQLAELATLHDRMTALECFVGTIQQQLTSHEQPDTPMHGTVQHGASMHAPVHFDNPDDAVSVRWNLTVPRGLKRTIQEQAKALGVDETKRVQALLWHGIQAEEAGQ